MGGVNSSGHEDHVERMEVVEDIRAAERQIEAGEGVAHEDAKARAGV